MQGKEEGRAGERSEKGEGSTQHSKTEGSERTNTGGLGYMWPPPRTLDAAESKAEVNVRGGVSPLWTWRDSKTFTPKACLLSRRDNHL